MESWSQWGISKIHVFWALTEEPVKNMNDEWIFNSSLFVKNMKIVNDELIFNSSHLPG